MPSRRYESYEVCHMLFRAGIINVAEEVQSLGEGQFSYSDLTWYLPDTTSRCLRLLVNLGMVESDGGPVKTGYYSLVGSHPLWDFLEGIKTACSQHDRGEKVTLRDEPSLTKDEWAKIRDWHLSQGKSLMSGGSLLIYLLDGLSGLLHTGTITIPYHIPKAERRYWVTVDARAHQLILWKNVEMISPFNTTNWHDSAWRREASPFWPAIASLKDAVLSL